MKSYPKNPLESVNKAGQEKVLVHRHPSKVVQQLFREWNKMDFPKPIRNSSFGKIASLIPETTVHYFF